MGKTQNGKFYCKNYRICVLLATVSNCENVTVVMMSTAYGTMKKIKQQQKEVELSSPQGGKGLPGTGQD